MYKKTKTQNTRLNITVPNFRVNESRSQPTNQPIKKLIKGRDLQRVQVDGCWSIQLHLRTSALLGCGTETLQL